MKYSLVKGGILLLLSAMLLCSCSRTRALNVPVAPDVSVPEPIGVKSFIDRDHQPDPEKIYLAFTKETDNRITKVEYVGDGEAKDLLYGNGVYFVLLDLNGIRYIGALDATGKTLFRGIPDERITDWEIMGFISGYACFYSPSAERTFVCDVNGRYTWTEMQSGAIVSATADGILSRMGNIVSLYHPISNRPSVSYTLPEGAELLFADAQCATLRMQGRYYTLNKGQTNPVALPSSVVPFVRGYHTASGAYAVVTHQTMKKTLPLPDPSPILSVLASGEDYVWLEQERQTVFCSGAELSPEEVKLPADTVFCGRTEDGFFYRVGETYYRFTCAQNGVAYQPGDDPEWSMAQALCATSKSLCGVALIGNGFSAPEGYRINELHASDLLKAVQTSIVLLQEMDVDSILPVYLCGTILENNARVPFLKQEDAYYVNATDVNALRSVFEDLFGVAE